ncbi:glycosyltransferase family 4 protein [Mesorhizobium sp. SB112]|uniref:glycosyltransferase family 4 protein n=1 Tax=Mesorhizobium sp. SB112 TaxID=3151853 RepID=UPI0032640F07
MRLLFATSIVPDGNSGSGYEIANAIIIDALLRAGADVTVMGFAWPGNAPSNPQKTILLGEIDVRTESASPLQKIRWLAKAVLSGLTFASAKLRTVNDETVRNAIEKAGPFDGYVLNSVQFAAAFEKVLADNPSIFVAHNVEHRSAAENAEAAQGGFQRFLFRREARLLKTIEKRLCDRAKFVFTLAEEDRTALGVASADKSAALPLVTQTVPPPKLEARRIDCDAALIGTWTWQPNRIGLEWFLEKIVPLLPADFRIRIAGHMPSGVTSDHPGVKFVGRVPDAQEFVRGAAVIPLISTAGTGVQLKTIETFELGLPSVATKNSLRGIDHLPENCIVTDEPVEFARALVKFARGEMADVDGSDFYDNQRRALDAGIRAGLDKIRSGDESVAT